MEMYLYFDYSQAYFAEESSSPSYIQLFESMQLKSWINIENLHGPNNYMSAFNCDLNKDKISCVKTNKKQSSLVVSKDEIYLLKLEIFILIINPQGNGIANFKGLEPDLLGSICFR